MDDVELEEDDEEGGHAAPAGNNQQAQGRGRNNQNRGQGGRGQRNNRDRGDSRPQQDDGEYQAKKESATQKALAVGLGGLATLGIISQDTADSTVGSIESFFTDDEGQDSWLEDLAEVSGEAFMRPVAIRLVDLMLKNATLRSVLLNKNVPVWIISLALQYLMIRLPTKNHRFNRLRRVSKELVQEMGQYLSDIRKQAGGHVDPRQVSTTSPVEWSGIALLAENLIILERIERLYPGEANVKNRLAALERVCSAMRKKGPSLAKILARPITRDAKHLDALIRDEQEKNTPIGAAYQITMNRLFGTTNEHTDVHKTVALRVGTEQQLQVLMMSEDGRKVSKETFLLRLNKLPELDGMTMAQFEEPLTLAAEPVEPEPESAVAGAVSTTVQTVKRTVAGIGKAIGGAVPPSLKSDAQGQINRGNATRARWAWGK